MLRFAREREIRIATLKSTAFRRSRRHKSPISGFLPMLFLQCCVQNMIFFLFMEMII